MPELRIIFPETAVDLELPPNVDVRAGAQDGFGRINNNWFWRMLVKLGFRLGKVHDIEKIRASVPGKFREAFETGLAG